MLLNIGLPDGAAYRFSALWATESSMDLQGDSKNPKHQAI
jgi:hypothetical protein